MRLLVIDAMTEDQHSTPARPQLIDLAANPALWNSQHHKRDRIPPRPEAQVPGGHNTHKAQNDAYITKNHSVVHGLFRREARCEPSPADADDDAIGSREQSECIGDRLVHGREHAGYVQHDVDKRRDYDDDEHARDHSPDRFLSHESHPWPPQILSAPSSRSCVTRSIG